jgi:hypothetical protein
VTKTLARFPYLACDGPNNTACRYGGKTREQVFTGANRKMRAGCRPRFDRLDMLGVLAAGRRRRSSSEDGNRHPIKDNDVSKSK